MNREETTGAQGAGTAARPEDNAGAGRRRSRHEIAVVQAELRRMHRRAAWSGRKPRGRVPTAARD